MNSDFRQKLALAVPELAAETLHSEEHLLIFDSEGSFHPPHNYLGIVDTFRKFKRDFMPLCPLRDPLGRHIKVRIPQFPKFLNLVVKPRFPPKKPHTIVELIERYQFIADEYEFEQDRLQALFWIPDVVNNPDAIYRKKKDYGKIPADHVYIKVYKVEGSPVKVLFTQKVGKRETFIVTSYLTSRSTAKKYIEGQPIYRRKQEKPPL